MFRSPLLISSLKAVARAHSKDENAYTHSCLAVTTAGSVLITVASKCRRKM